VTKSKEGFEEPNYHFARETAPLAREKRALLSRETREIFTTTVSECAKTLGFLHRRRCGTAVAQENWKSG
jgi:hypothetical protein